MQTSASIHFTPHRTSRLLRIALVSVGFAGLTFSYSHTFAEGQVPQPTFRAGVNGVLVDLRVVNEQGEFVADLAKEDFRIFEDGREQTVSAFDVVHLPIVPRVSSFMGDPRIEADVASNGLPIDGRLYAIVLDDTQGTSGDARYSFDVRAAAREFITRYITDADRAALIATSGRRDVSQEFTNNRQRLLDAVDRFEEGYGQPIQTLKGSTTPFSAKVVPLDTLYTSDSRHTVTVSLEALTKWLAGIAGQRKTLVVISHHVDCGVSVPFEGGPGGFPLSLLAQQEVGEDRDVVGAAALANVSIYTVKPRSPDLIAGDSPDGTWPVPLLPRSGDFEMTYGRSETCRQGLSGIARESGGRALIYGPGVFSRIVQESSSYYLLGYVSTNSRKDGKFRKIEVQTTRPGLRVITRSGYVASDSRPAKKLKDPEGIPPALAEVFQSPLPVPGLTLSVSAPPFRVSGSKATVPIVVQALAEQLQFSETPTRFDGRMTLVIAAAGPDGKVKAGERGTLTMHLSSETHARIIEHGGRVLSRLSLSPGRYQLRVAAIDAIPNGVRGSVHYDLVVPDFSKGPVTMSGMVLASTADATPTTGRVGEWQRIFSAIPTAERRFKSDDELRVFVEVYDNDKKAGHQIDVVTTIRDESGNAVFTHPQTFPGERDKRATGTIRVVTSIPLNGLSPGPYALITEARDSAHPGEPVTRQIPLTIE